MVGAILLEPTTPAPLELIVRLYSAHRLYQAGHRLPDQSALFQK